MAHFQPGQSGNPGGKPKQKPFRDALLLALNRDENDIIKGRTKLQQIAESLVNKAVAEDVPAIKEIADRVDGKVPQAVVGDEEHPGLFDPLAALLQAIDGKTRSIGLSDAVSSVVPTETQMTGSGDEKPGDYGV